MVATVGGAFLGALIGWQLGWEGAGCFVVGMVWCQVIVELSRRRARDGK